MSAPSDPPRDFREFWPRYLRDHSRPRTRRLHVVGTGLGLLLLAAAALRRDWRLLVAAPLAGYAFAWYSHFRIEGNRPATFRHPLWSLWGDLRLFALTLTGGLGPHLEAAGIEPGAAEGEAGR